MCEQRFMFHNNVHIWCGIEFKIGCQLKNQAVMKRLQSASRFENKCVYERDNGMCHSVRILKKKNPKHSLIVVEVVCGRVCMYDVSIK